MPHQIIISLISVLILFLGGCRGASPPVKYYTLQARAAQALPAADRSGRKPSIAIGPLVLPDYLDRSDLVTRSSPNQVQIQETHRWAGTLQDEIMRVLSENIRSLTGARRVEALPWAADFSPDLRVRITIRAFEGEPGKIVRLVADWWVGASGGATQPPVTTTVIEESVTANGMEAVAAAMSRALAGLSRRIAENILLFIPHSTAAVQQSPDRKN